MLIITTTKNQNLNNHQKLKTTPNIGSSKPERKAKTPASIKTNIRLINRTITTAKVSITTYPPPLTLDTESIFLNSSILFNVASSNLLFLTFLAPMPL